MCLFIWVASHLDDTLLYTAWLQPRRYQFDNIPFRFTAYWSGAQDLIHAQPPAHASVFFSKVIVKGKAVKTGREEGRMWSGNKNTKVAATDRETWEG